jgi:endoglucanase
MKGFHHFFADYRSWAEKEDYSFHPRRTGHLRDLLGSDGFGRDGTPHHSDAHASALDTALPGVELHDISRLFGFSHEDLRAVIDGPRAAPDESAHRLTDHLLDSVVALCRSAEFSTFRHWAASATTMPADQDGATLASALTHESLTQPMQGDGSAHFDGPASQPDPLPVESQVAAASPLPSASHGDGSTHFDGPASQSDPLPVDNQGTPASPLPSASSNPLGAHPVDSAAPAGSPTASAQSHMLLGVNLAGGEFGSPPGTYGIDYTYPSVQEIDYYASKGLDIIRVPFLAERVQADANGPVNSDELSRLDLVVQYATSKGMSVVLDMHNYGYIHGGEIGTSETATNAFADLWGKLASHFADQPSVIFGLMNEPHDQTASQWIGAANAAIDSIRQAGATQEVLVPGTHWDGAWTWTSSDNASVIGSGVKDPAHNYAFEVHQYLDSDGSGTHPDVVSSTIGAERLKPATEWAEATGNKLFLGEFGVASDSASLNSADAMLTYMQQHQNAWQGATYWAGGPWWGNYMFSIEPTNGIDKPQMSVLTDHLGW